MQVCWQGNVSPKVLVHSSAGPWHFIKVQCKSQHWNQYFNSSYRQLSMVCRSLSHIAFSDAKQLLGWRKTTIGLLHRVAWKKRYKVWLKSIDLLQNYKMKSKGTIVVLKYTKMLIFEEIDKNIQFNSLFLRIREKFISVQVRQVTYFTWGLKFSSKAVSSLRFNCFRDA